MSKNGYMDKDAPNSQPYNLSNESEVKQFNANKPQPLVLFKDNISCLEETTNTKIPPHICDDVKSEKGSTLSTSTELSSNSDLLNSPEPLLWLKEQMKANHTPQKILEMLLPNNGSMFNTLNNYESWDMILQILTQPSLFKRNKIASINTITDFIDLLETSKNILVLTGAGVSVSCGIPDFRSRDGLYARLSQDFPDLPDPQAMFDINYFKYDPRPFFKFAKEIYPGRFKPSLGHLFIKFLERQNKLLRNYTQNIDTLENEAGIERKIECHGSFATASCTRCNYQVDAEAIKQDIYNQIVPLCPICHHKNHLKQTIPHCNSENSEKLDDTETAVSQQTTLKAFVASHIDQQNTSNSINLDITSQEHVLPSSSTPETFPSNDQESNITSNAPVSPIETEFKEIDRETAQKAEYEKRILKSYKRDMDLPDDSDSNDSLDYPHNYNNTSITHKFSQDQTSFSKIFSPNVKTRNATAKDGNQQITNDKSRLVENCKNKNSPPAEDDDPSHLDVMNNVDVSQKSTISTDSDSDSSNPYFFNFLASHSSKNTLQSCPNPTNNNSNQILATSTSVNYEEMHRNAMLLAQKNHHTYKAVMKPDIVFFGEGLGEKFHQALEADKECCDLLVVMGSSMKVRPVSLLPNTISPDVPQILINKEPLPQLNFDIEFLGDCDTIVTEILKRMYRRFYGDSFKSKIIRDASPQKYIESKELYSNTQPSKRPYPPEDYSCDGSKNDEFVPPNSSKDQTTPFKRGRFSTPFDTFNSTPKPIDLDESLWTELYDIDHVLAILLNKNSSANLADENTIDKEKTESEFPLNLEFIPSKKGSGALKTVTWIGSDLVKPSQIMVWDQFVQELYSLKVVQNKNINFPRLIAQPEDLEGTKLPDLINNDDNSFNNEHNNMNLVGDRNESSYKSLDFSVKSYGRITNLVHLYALPTVLNNKLADLAQNNNSNDQVNSVPANVITEIYTDYIQKLPQICHPLQEPTPKLYFSPCFLLNNQDVNKEKDTQYYGLFSIPNAKFVADNSNEPNNSQSNVSIESSRYNHSIIDKDGIVTGLPNSSFLYVPPNRYIFPEAEMKLKKSQDF